MRRTGAVRWCASPADDVRGGTAAWILELRDDVDPALTPNAVDLAEVGARHGVEASRFLQRRLVLRRLVARWCGAPASEVVIGYDASGRPEVRRPADGPRCAVTARGDVAGFALSDAPVGIDLEPVTPGAIAWAVLAPSEQAELSMLESSQRERLVGFLELWTLKEAYLKAQGSGLLRNPADIAISRHDRLLRDGDATYRLATSTVHRTEIGPQPITAACISLP